MYCQLPRMRAPHIVATPLDRPATQSGTLRLGGDRPVHRLGFGAMRLTGPGIWGEPPDRVQAIAVLRRAVELGVDFIDTADSYGPETSERLIAEALFPYPADLVIATKGGLERPGPDRWTPNGQPAHLRAACEGSLRRLRLERIELYQLHRIDPAVPLDDQLDVLLRLREEGKIRLLGLSEVSVADIARVRQRTPIVSVQNRYNLVDRHASPPTAGVAKPQAPEQVLEYCERHGIAFIPWYPLVAGQLAGRGVGLARMAARVAKSWLRGRSAATAAGSLARVARRLGASPAQVALAWLLRRSPVILPIPGTSNLKHLEENVAAARLELSERDFRELAGD